MFSSVTPICSAIDMKRLLNTSSMTGSHSVPTAKVRSRGTTRVRTRWLFAVSSACQSGSTTVVAVWLANDGGAGDAVAGHEHVPVIDRRVVLFSLHVRRHQGEMRHVVGCRPVAPVRLLRLRHHADAFDRCGFDDQPLLRHDETVVPVVRGLEASRHLRGRPELDRVRGVAPLVADVRAADDLDPLVRDVCSVSSVSTWGGEIVERRRKLRHQRIVEGRFDRLLPERPDVGETHAVGR